MMERTGWGILIAVICLGGNALAADDNGVKVNAACQLERSVAEPGAQPSRGLGFSFGGFSLGGARRGRGDAGAGVSVNQAELWRDALRPEKAEVLAANGPHFEDVFKLSCLPVQALVRGGWPLVVDYQLEEGTVAAVEIHLPGREPLILPLPAEGERRALTMLLPASLGDEPVAAVILVRALLANSSPPTPGHLQLFSLGAGPLVADPPSLDQLSFQPETIHLATQEVAHLAFLGRVGFKLAKIDILGVDERDGVIVARIARSYVVPGGISAGARIGEDPILGWNGTLDDRQVSLGKHLMQVRAWSKLEDGGSWVVAWSPDRVSVKP